MTNKYDIMKKVLLMFGVLFNMGFNAYSQTTSLTIDCQTPGWLSSYINPSDISSLRNLKVQGQINEVDLSTIGNLVKNYNLKGHLDLEDVTIIGNCLSAEMFGVTDCQLEYLALPKNIGKMERCIEWVNVDTLVCGSLNNPNVFLGRIYFGNIMGVKYSDYCSSPSLFRVKHLILREGVESFSTDCITNPITNGMKNEVIESIIFPTTIKNMVHFDQLLSLTEMNVPEGVEYLGSRCFTNIHISSDTLFIPSSVKTFMDTWAGRDYRYARYAYPNHNTQNENGRIKCLYLPDNLEKLWVDALHYGAKVAIHIKSKTPPVIENGYFNSNTIVYVPVGCKEVYKATGHSNGGSGYTQWTGATILEEVYAEQISILVPSVLYANETYNFVADFIPTTTTFKEVSWSSSDNNILSVSKSGECTTKTCGEVQVTAMSADKSCSATKTIHVYSHTSGISISENSLTMNVGSIAALQASTLPLETSDGQIEWSSSNDMIASVDNEGTIKAIGRGNCTIKATSVDGGVTASCEVTVIQPVESVTLEQHNMTMKVGDTANLYALVAPTTADNKTLIWSSSDEEVATVDEKGNITALKGGTVTIKVVSEDNQEATDVCNVVISQPVTGVNIDKSTITLEGIGATATLTSTIIPEGASNTEVKWTSSNESVCIVSNGTVVAVGEGTCVIIVTTEDGGYIATCTVTVTNATGISSIQNDGISFQIYDTNGAKRANFQRGVNIIRFADGTMKKILIK